MNWPRTAHHSLDQGDSWVRASAAERAEHRLLAQYSGSDKRRRTTGNPHLQWVGLELNLSVESSIRSQKTVSAGIVSEWSAQIWNTAFSARSDTKQLGG